jgi:two-component system, NarL family, sensor histidine kinase DesK
VVDPVAVDPVVLRRMRRTTLLIAMIAIVPIGLVAAALSADTAFEGWMLALGLILSLPVFFIWTTDGIGKGGVFAAVFGLAVWLSCAVVGASPLGFFSAALTVGLILHRLPWPRLPMTLLLTGVIAAFGATVYLTHPPSPELAERYILMPSIGTLIIVGVVALCERALLLVYQAERAKRAEAALAVERERVRVAGDLHDIQGHALHVARLKLAVAERLLGADPARAATEIGEVRALIGDTIGRTRELAYANHELNLPAELENTRQLAEAAGIAVVIVGDASGARTAHPLLAQVLREATTNLLRHAKPTRVAIAITPDSVRVENDGVDAGGAPAGEGAAGDDPALRGLARLRDRLEAEDGELEIERATGRFAVVATIPRKGAA